MTERARERLIVGGLLLLGSFVFTFGITWGLPSRKTDAILFGERKPWSGAEILALAPQRSGGAADVDVNPAVRGSVLNDTDAKRAEIVRRYRLFTYQPDEMITMMALAGMHPAKRDFDPRLYQYGGLWIYPVGGLIKLLLHPRADQAYYLDHPQAFGQFYVVARAYAAAWGLVGAWAVYRLMRQLSRFAAVVATLLYITMPIVVNLAHEAKPHLPGTALMLLAALAARNFIQLGGRRRLALMSALCGAAAGMILSAGVAIFIALIAIVLRAWRERNPLSLSGGGEGRGEASGVPFEDEDAPHPDPLAGGRGGGERHRLGWMVGRCGASLAIALTIYAFTNPYVIKHLLTDRAVLSQNLANSRAMYRVDLIGGIGRAVVLIAAGCEWLTLIGGGVGLTVLLQAWRGPRPSRRVSATRAGPIFWPLIGVSAVVAVQFAALAAGKPGEYGRFALVIDVTLAMLAAAGLSVARLSSQRRTALSLILLLGTMLPNAIYEYDFGSDSRNITRRDRLASTLESLRSPAISVIGLQEEPAPYLMPPVDLWKWTLALLPFDSHSSERAQVLVRPADTAQREPTAYRRITEAEGADWFAAECSWANKRIDLWIDRTEP